MLSKVNEMVREWIKEVSIAKVSKESREKLIFITHCGQLLFDILCECLWM